MDRYDSFNELDIYNMYIAIVVYIGNVIDKLYNNDFNINILGSAVFILAMLGIRFVCNFLINKVF